MGGKDLRSEPNRIRDLKMVGDGNVFAHDYEKINYDIVYKDLHKEVKDIEEFMCRLVVSKSDLTYSVI